MGRGVPPGGLDLTDVLNEEKAKTVPKGKGATQFTQSQGSWRRLGAPWVGEACVTFTKRSINRGTPSQTHIHDLSVHVTELFSAGQPEGQK